MIGDFFISGDTFYMLGIFCANILHVLLLVIKTYVIFHISFSSIEGKRTKTTVHKTVNETLNMTG